MASAKDFFSDAEKQTVVDAIRSAEQHTSGEIRVHMDDRCDGNAYDRAVKIFMHLNMDRKPFRNAVLIYVAVKDKKFSIIGDIAIHEKVGNNYWKDITHQLHDDFKNGRFTQGILNSIHSIGNTLSAYFPHLDELERNSIPDDISFE